MEPTILAKNIAALRASLKDKQSAFADRIGVNQSYISKWETQNKEPSTRPLVRMADLAGVSVEAFMDKPWNPGKSNPAKPLDIARAPDRLPTRDVSADDPSVEISALDLSYSMGPGTELESYIEEEPIRFDPAFLRRISRAPYHRLKLARGVGDSMQPTLLPGDVVMIDTTQNQLNMQDRIYAVALYGAAAIKRLRRGEGGRVRIISDNPTVPEDVIDPEDIVIHGRVIWFSREL